ncbi:capsule polysaccharide export inner-membrane protein CtrB [Komagataeibacter europaeus NBRC 3261]|uniref:Capsule polysaccharide export inner-membrane protein CtrB n=1 Tax=Komagataeibacter europaeus NBRC 3261 TaxID=1234669 RepID=A0A0D6Q155_KOMEU|nr:capsule biosynthesis protein [Komagataeibacter europaeus]GAN97287.1 capsule polysaccharide export inner-membrane protein CtrB [Komagataeibacter europaeus NBRC 3261]
MNTDVHAPDEGQYHPEDVSVLARLFNGLRNRIRNNLPFTLCVIMPTFLTALYLILIATPQFISEAHFVVRGRSGQSGISLSNILQSSSGGAGATSENTYVVQDYMQSRDAAEILIKQNHLLDVYSRPEADFLARYSLFGLGKKFEHFYKYYKRHVIVEQDTETNISILTVRTFRAQDSQQIARALLDAGENLVNEINRRQRENLIHATAMEVDAAEAKLRDINQKLAEYRNTIELIDPMRQSVPMVSYVTSLQNMLTSTNMQLSQLRASAPNSPLIAAYQRQADILADQIKKSSGQITGPGESLVPKITGYEDLMVQRDIQQRVLASDVASLEVAKQQANQQMIYVDEVAQPNMADWAEYPRDTIVLVVMFLSCLGLYIMGKLLIASARERNLH